MKKLDSILGAKFQDNKESLITRNFELRGFDFKVRIPTFGETEQMYERLSIVDEQKIQTVYETLTKEIVRNKDTPSDLVVFTEDDIIVDGRSMRDSAKTTVIAQARIVEYFKLLIPEEGQSWDDVDYSVIDASLPWSVQIEVVEKIMECISPSYKDIKSK